MKMNDPSVQVGSEWLTRGMILQAIGLLIAASAGLIYLVNSKQTYATSAETGSNAENDSVAGK